jgi:hypothetical protein
MSLDPPPYLSSLQNNIRTRPIPWDGAVRAGTISDDQLSKIRAVDKVRKEQRKQVVESDINGYRALFVGNGSEPSILESAAKRADVVQYILVLLADLLDGVYGNLDLRHSANNIYKGYQQFRKLFLSIQTHISPFCLFSSNRMIPKALFHYSPLLFSRT